VVQLLVAAGASTSAKDKVGYDLKTQHTRLAVVVIPKSSVCNFALIHYVFRFSSSVDVHTRTAPRHSI